jgi:hydroxyethylthiazole kinase-like uncharacterized protein yjeF
MEKYYEPEDVRQADVNAAEKCGIASITLMENAGTGAARIIMKSYPAASRFLILAGHGNNGGDGFVAARALVKSGKDVFVLKTANDRDYKGDALTNLRALRELASEKCSIIESNDIIEEDITAFIDDADCVIDALLGTGSSGSPRGEIARLISLCRTCGKVVSLDIPSGIDPKSGAVYDPCVKASLTITFLAPKTGMSEYPAREMCGRIITAGIGADASVVLRDAKPYVCYDRSDLAGMLPRYGRDIHKGSRGGLLICGGSENYRGAPLLAAMGALRAGAGLVVLAIPDFMVDGASMLLPEAVFAPLHTLNGIVEPASVANSISPWLNRCGAAVFGPGAGRDDNIGEVTQWFLENWQSPLLVDADGLYFLGKLQGQTARKQNLLITPHAGEAAALLNTTAQIVNADRKAAVDSLSGIASVALLKGSGTMLSDSKEIRKILEGSPSLAVPGSGDVLSGTIGAFLAAGLGIFDAATAGALVHAAAGSEIEKRRGVSGTLAREIANEISALVG